MNRASVLFLITIIFAQSLMAEVVIGSHGEFRVDGKPFFPIMQWMQNHKNMRRQAGYGINVFSVPGNTITAQGWCDSAQAVGVYACCQYRPEDVESVKNHPGLFGWFFGDEPDLQGHEVPPDTIRKQYEAIKQADPSHPTFLTLTSRFYSETDLPAWMNGSDAFYYEYPKYTDVIGFDLYPVYGWCRPDWIHQVPDATGELVQKYVADETKGIYAWIECVNTSSKWCSNSSRGELDGPYPNEIETQVWLSIIHGAKAIGYFTHSWECPGYTQWCVSPEQIEMMTRVNAAITDLTDVLCGPDAVDLFDLEVSGIDGNDGRIDAFAKVHGDSIYIIAAHVLNFNNAAENQRAEFTVPFAEGTVRVYGEDRNVALSAQGTFVDTFSSQKPVHIYTMKTKQSTPVISKAVHSHLEATGQKRTFQVRGRMPKRGSVYNLKGERIPKERNGRFARQPVIMTRD
ncbi:MAG: hypothetical protein ACOCXC_05400 [Fibrobacterota bacterium]